MKLKDNIKTLRKRDNLTQGDLAKKLHIKQYNISDYEIGRIEPSITTLSKMADIFEVSTDYLLGRKDSDEEANRPEKTDKYLATIVEAFKDLDEDDKKMIVDIVNFSIGNIIKDNKSK